MHPKFIRCVLCIFTGVVEELNRADVYLDYGAKGKVVDKCELMYNAFDGPGQSGTVLTRAVVVHFENLNEEEAPFLDA